MSEKKFMTGRRWFSLAMILVAVPLTLWLCRGFRGNKFFITALLIIVEMMIPFFVSFERRKPQARELVVIAVMSAITVAGRGAFLFLPNFSPTCGLIMISGAALGAESGFMVGAMGMLASNFFFGQTLYTPFQMFAYGFAGYLVGLLVSSKVLSTKKIPFAVTGAILYFTLIGPLLDTSIILVAAGQPYANWGVYLSGMPVNLMQATCTFLTIFFVSRPMLEKLERIKVKYGMMESGNEV